MKKYTRKQRKVHSVADLGEELWSPISSASSPREEL